MNNTSSLPHLETLVSHKMTSHCYYTGLHHTNTEVVVQHPAALSPNNDPAAQCRATRAHLRRVNQVLCVLSLHRRGGLALPSSENLPTLVQRASRSNDTSRAPFRCATGLCRPIYARAADRLGLVATVALRLCFQPSPADSGDFTCI